MSANAHRVFENSSAVGSFHSEITVSDRQAEALRQARDEIRSCLREGLRGWETLVEKAQLFDDTLRGVDTPALRPKFRMQGSFSYRTQVEPAHLPPQEIDLDDGMFLPVSFLQGGGRVKPVVASRGLFLAVERALMPLCNRRGWKLITNKPSCVRVEISDTAHVDIALYAIPDAQFAQLVENAAIKTAGGGTADHLLEALEFQDAVYRQLSAETLMLAHRVEGWKPSDPRKLDEWFSSAIEQHGPQLRRVCKYLKGWRDFQWKDECRLSSIALMAATVQAFDNLDLSAGLERDDLALLQVAQSLPDFLARRIPNPVVEGQYLDEGWSTEQRNEFVTKASELANRLHRALNRSSTATLVLKELTKGFGDRIPQDEDLIQVDALSAPYIRSASERDAAAVAAINEVKNSGTGTQPWTRLEN